MINLIIISSFDCQTPYFTLQHDLLWPLKNLSKRDRHHSLARAALMSQIDTLSSFVAVIAILFTMRG